MTYKALVSFAGAVSMGCGEVREISNEEIVKDLLRAGYIEAVETVKAPAKQPKKKAVKPNESK